MFLNLLIELFVNLSNISFLIFIWLSSGLIMSIFLF